MKDKLCAKCKNTVKKDFITYITKVWDEEIEIPMVEGYKCSECGYVEVDEKVEARLKVKVLEHKLEMYKQGKVKILLVSDIKHVRESKGVAQGAIGDALDFTEQRFGAIERNYNTPTVYLSGVIAELLGVSIYDFYSFEPVPMDVFLELENLDRDFNMIAGLPEVRKEHYKVTDEERDIRDEVNHLKTLRRRLRKKRSNKIEKSNKTQDKSEKDRIQAAIKELNDEEKQLDKQIEELDLEKAKLQKKLSSLLKKIRNLEKKHNSILNQGYCLSKYDWRQVQERYSDKFKKYSN